MRDIIKEQEIFDETRNIVGELTDNESAKIKAGDAISFLESKKLTKDELIGVFHSGAGFITGELTRIKKSSLIARIVDECLMSFDISLKDLANLK